MSTQYYNPRDFTPEQVDAGQRKVNYALTEASRKLVAVLVAVKNAINVPPGQMQQGIADIERAIDEASAAINKVAEIIPPGCDPRLP
jgi:hypothetical protein